MGGPRIEEGQNVKRNYCFRKYHKTSQIESHANVSAASRAVLWHDGSRRRDHRRRDLSHARHRRRAAALAGVGAAGVGDRWHSCVDRRVVLGRAGPAASPCRRRLRVSARDLRSAAGISVRLDGGARHRDGRHRRGGGDIRRLFAGAVWPAAPVLGAARCRRDRVARRHQLRRRKSRRDHAEHLYGTQTLCARDPDRRRDPSRRAVAAPPPRRPLAAAASRRPGVGSRAHPLYVWRLATNQLHCRRDRRAREESAARPGARRCDRRRGLPPRERRVPARAGRRRTRGQHGTRRRHDAGVARPGRRQDHCGGNRDLDVRLPEPRDSGDTAGAASDGGGRRVLPAARGAASGLSHAHGGDRCAGRVCDPAGVDGNVRAAGGLRDVWRLDLFWTDGRSAVRVSAQGAGSGEQGGGFCSRLPAPCTLSCTGLSCHADTLRCCRSLRSLQLHRVQSAQCDNRCRAYWTWNPRVSLLAEPPMTRTSSLVVCLATLLSSPLAAQHEHLGRVVFPISCNPEAQQRFTRAMALLHSFWWEQGQGAFQAVADADSTCAMAYWGMALNAWGNPFAGGPGGNAGKGDPLRRGATARERGFLAAVAALYRGYDSIPNTRRLQAYSDTLARVYRDFPNDTEVAIYYALSLVETAPKTDTTFARQKQAAAILNPLYRRFPQHPGLAHYIIHANDSPRLATFGLDAARRYAQIAPSAPHAQHMPSHIFVRLGLWDETIAANHRAFEAGLEDARAHNQPVAPERLHALDYM